MTTDNANFPEEGAETQAETTTATEAVATDAQRTFSQDEVNQMMAKTRRETRSQFGDYNQLKERAQKADELEQAQMSEAQKMEQRAIDAEKRASEAQQQIASAMISAEVKVRASQMGIIDPDAAFLLLDQSNVNYSMESGVSGVDEALTLLLESKPYLKSANRIPNINPESGAMAPVLRLSEDQREAARLMGMTEEDYARGL